MDELVVSYQSSELKKTINYDKASEQLIFNLRQEIIVQEIDELHPKYVILGKRQYEAYLGWQNYHFEQMVWDYFGKFPLILINDPCVFVCCDEMYTLPLLSVHSEPNNTIFTLFDSQETNLKNKNIEPKYLVLGTFEYSLLKNIENFKSDTNFYKYKNYEIVLLPLKHYLYLCSDPKTSLFLL